MTAEGLGSSSSFGPFPCVTFCVVGWRLYMESLVRFLEFVRGRAYKKVFAQ